MRIKRGSILITLGLLMLASAGGLTAYNLYDEYQAGEQAQEALALFDDLIAEPDAAGAGEPVWQAYAPQTPVSQTHVSQAPVPQTPVSQTSMPQPPVYDAPASYEAVPQLDFVLPMQDGGYPAEPLYAPAGTPEPELFFYPQQTDAAASVMPSATDAPYAGIPALDFPLTSYEDVEIPDYVLNPNMRMPVKEKNGQAYIGVLEIPALNLTLPVISEWDYDRLKKAPCRYDGSAYLDNLVIAAHNYKTHFGNLKKLNAGDSVIFTDAVGNRFEYEVVLTETLMPRDVKEMKSGEFALSLFTCTVGGSYRVTVRCDRVQ